MADKINPKLWSVVSETLAGRQNPLIQSGVARLDARGLVQTYVYTDDIAGTTQQLKALGAKIDGSSSAMGAIQAWVSPGMMDDSALLPAIKNITLPDYALRNVTSAGDGILSADKVRNQFAAQGIDGTGIKIGVISDGANHRANVGAELPPVTVDPAHPGSGDEGTAMLEIVHDLAPGAQLYFSGVQTSLDMDNCIDWLMSQGCNVIVDDLLFPGESYFSDSTIAQKAQQAVNAGIVYVTSAGNFADDQHYQAQYTQLPSVYEGGYLHSFGSFDGGNNVSIPNGQNFRAFLQWSDAWGTSANDYNLYLINSTTYATLGSSTIVQNGNDLPLEWISWTNNTGATVQAELWIVKKTAAAPRELELFTIGNSSMQYETDGDALVGQEAVAGVMSVAAANAASPSSVTAYSSRGGSTIYTNFATQTKTIRQTLDGTAIDGVQTKVGQLGYFYNPFYGTSAAAPHAAAIAALVRQANPALTPAQVLSTMAATATDLGAAGYDVISGAGRYNALDAVYKAFKPATPDLSSASDSGVSSTDNITNDTTPTFQGEVPAGSFVRLYIDGVQVATQQLAAGATNWSMTAPAIGNGGHTAKIRVASSSTVALSNNSADSTMLHFSIDTVAPTLLTKSFEYNLLGAPQRLSFVLSESSPTMGVAQLSLLNTTTSSSIQAGDTSLSLPGGNEIRFTFPGFQYGALPDGDYTASLGGIEDTAGNALAANEYAFFFLNGDANHDRSVTLLDFNTLAANFGGTSRTFSQADFTYDGNVTLADFNLLAGRFGASLDASMSGGPGESLFGDTKIEDTSEMLEEVLV